MKVFFTLITLLVVLIQVPAQKVTGIWRGYFSSSSGVYREGAREEMYKYEVQIEQLSNNGIKGVTFSYKSTVFYGKATLQGIYNVKSKTLLLKETELVDLKVGVKSEPCLMTCYLDYSKVGKLEVFHGTFISTNLTDKGDCGSGKVYLEKVPMSDFDKEDFLKKPRKDSLIPKSATKETKIIIDTVTKKVNSQKTVPNSKPPIAINPSTKIIQKNTPLKPTVTPKNQEQIPQQNTTRKFEELIETPTKPPLDIEEQTKRKTPLPSVLIERENNLVTTIITDEENIQIDLFDNGTIDNDTISVYHNNILVIKKGRLAFNPISLSIKNSVIENIHELIVIAENLGEIPPNTALMVITAGKKRYELFLASNESRNAKVVIQYVPKK
jgi:hypothetical protein